MNPLVLVVDDEPDVEVLFRQQFRRDLRSERFTMEFAQSAPIALQRRGRRRYWKSGLAAIRVAAGSRRPA